MKFNPHPPLAPTPTPRCPHSHALPHLQVARVADLEWLQVHLRSVHSMAAQREGTRWLGAQPAAGQGAALTHRAHRWVLRGTNQKHPQRLKRSMYQPRCPVAGRRCPTGCRLQRKLFSSLPSPAAACSATSATCVGSQPWVVVIERWYGDILLAKNMHISSMVPGYMCTHLHIGLQLWDLCPHRATTVALFAQYKW